MHHECLNSAAHPRLRQHAKFAEQRADEDAALGMVGLREQIFLGDEQFATWTLATVCMNADRSHDYGDNDVDARRLVVGWKSA